MDTGNEALEYTHNHVHGENNSQHDYEHPRPVLPETRHTHRLSPARAN